jgi:hypothetical protein
VSLADGKIFQLGRGRNSDACIEDVSISRLHATIRYEEGRFLLQDNGSKFGTLLAMKKPAALKLDSALTIQVGRTILSFTASASATHLQPGLAADTAAHAPPPFSDEHLVTEEVYVANLAKSGDGTAVNVGIKLDGVHQCRDCSQRFPSERARQVHWRFIHDPNRHSED